MELERMRRILAEAMGWHQIMQIGAPAWADSDGSVLYWADSTWSTTFMWRPDEDWKQCGLVTEEMRERRWGCSIWIDARGWTGVAWLSWNGETLGEAKCPTFTEAVSLAIAHALESEAVDG